MCASYAWSVSKAGFCLVEGTQCFTSDAFMQDYADAVKAPCDSVVGVMRCYSFDMQQEPLFQRRIGADVANMEHAQEDIRVRWNQPSLVSYLLMLRFVV